MDSYRPHAEDALPQRTRQGYIPDSIQQDFLLIKIQESRLSEKAVFAQAVLCETDGQSEVPFPVGLNRIHTEISS